MPTVAQIGNFSRPYCSEVHWAREFRALGWQVKEFQEPQHPKEGRPFLKAVEQWCADNRPQLVMFTRTWGLPPEAAALWHRLEMMGIVTCSYHLDLYYGLPRGAEIGSDPFWLTQYVFTADGDPAAQAHFESLGINHHWSSPAVVADECVAGNRRAAYDYDVVFVGSQQYHTEWPWRGQLTSYLAERYGERFHLFNHDIPIRGLDLNDLYATAKVVVGDSLHLPGHRNYWSDRYFETVGRGGFLIAPHIDGLDEFLTPGEHYAPYEHPGGNLTTEAALDIVGATVDAYLERPDERDRIRKAGQEHVRRHHTYRHRLHAALEIMGLVTAPRATTHRDEIIERLELGSGYSPTKGYTHLDANPAAPDVDIVGQAWPLELDDESVGELLAIDILEHLSYRDTAAVLADWFRVLTPGGRLHVQVPDAEMIMCWFHDEPSRLLQDLPADLPQTALGGATWRLLGGHADGVYVKAGEDFRFNAHYAMFSPRSLRLALEEAGFAVLEMVVNEHPNILVDAAKPTTGPTVATRRAATTKMATAEGLKIGLIARSEVARGLALLTKGFYDAMPVERVLLVSLPSRDCDLAPEWYPGATAIDVLPGYKMDERIVRPWLDGLDVVYTAETPYDWRMVRWCRSAGVKLVVHGMPEFVRHGQPGAEHLEHPDEWWWPTRWRLAHLPPGPVVPVPMPDSVPTAAPIDDRPLRVYHIAGKRAAGDRNGTDVFLDAIRGFDRDTIVTLHGLEGSLPPFTTATRATVIIDNIGPADRWEMHVNQHLLVLPRRYAGLCLPALEAASRGIAVMMPDCSPNDELASVLVPAMSGSAMRVPAGRIPTHAIHFYALAQEVNALNKDREALAAAMKRSFHMCPRWSTMRAVYLDHLQRVVNG